MMATVLPVLGVIPILHLRKLVVGTPAGLLAVSGEIEPGQFVVVDAVPEVATAVARTIVGLVPAGSGRIHIGGRDVTDLPPRDRHIGYVPAGGALLPHLTVEENIEYGLRHREMVERIRQDWLAMVVERLELVPTLRLRPHLLSDAQRLRASLARAVGCLPAALVLDLPTVTGGGDRMRDLVQRATPPMSPGPAVLVCSAHPQILAEATGTITPKDATAPDATAPDGAVLDDAPLDAA